MTNQETNQTNETSSLNEEVLGDKSYLHDTQYIEGSDDNSSSEETNKESPNKGPMDGHSSRNKEMLEKLELAKRASSNEESSYIVFNKNRTGSVSYGPIVSKIMRNMDLLGDIQPLRAFSKKQEDVIRDFHEMIVYNIVSLMEQATVPFKDIIKSDAFNFVDHLNEKEIKAHCTPEDGCGTIASDQKLDDLTKS